MKVPIQAMCQVDTHIWMTSAQGHLIVVNAVTHEITQQNDRQELVRDDVVDMKTINGRTGLFAVMYKSGLVIFISAQSTSPTRCSASSHKTPTFPLSLGAKSRPRQHLIKLSPITLSSPNLYATDVYMPEDDRLIEVWCGCDKGVIEIVIPPDGDFKPESALMLSTQDSSADIPPDDGIIQLKSSLHVQSNTTCVYALHGTGSVISCWRVGEQPILNAVIKLSLHINSPGITVTNP